MFQLGLWNSPISLLEVQDQLSHDPNRIRHFPSQVCHILPYCLSVISNLPNSLPRLCTLQTQYHQRLRWNIKHGLLYVDHQYCIFAKSF